MMFVIMRISDCDEFRIKLKVMKSIKVLGPGCPKCKTTYTNALEAVKQTGVDAEVIKIEDLQEMFKYDVLTTPVLIIDEEVKIKGRVADVREIVGLLTAD
jgi:small redox-active disulfide protein 2